MAGPVKTIVPIPFAGGIDSKTDPAQVPPGKLVDLQNGVFRQTGAVGRRWGYEALGKSVVGSPSEIASCAAIQPFNDELMLFDGQRAYSYVAANDAWVDKGSAVSVIQTNQQIVAGNAQQLSPDFATLGGVELYAWEDSRGGIRYSIVDAALGTIVVNDHPLYPGMASTARSPRVVPFAAANLILIVFDDGFGDVAYVTINPSNPAQAPTSADTVINSINGGYAFGTTNPGTSPVYFDAALSDDGLTVHFLANPTPQSSPGAAFYYYTAIDATMRTPVGWPVPVANHWFFSVPPASHPVMQLVANGPNMLAVSTTTTPSGGGRSIVSVASYVVATGAIVFFPTTCMSVPLASGEFEAVSGVLLNGVLTVLADSPVATSGFLGEPQFQQLWTATVDPTNGHVISAQTIFKRGVGLASKAFSYGGRIYVNVAFQSNLQSTYFTIDSSGNVVGKVFAGLCGGLVRNSDYSLPACPMIAPGVFKYANLVKGFPNTEAGAVVALLGVNATKLDFFDSNQFLSTSINGSLYTVGGVLQQYDGAQFVELGFHVYPEDVQLLQIGVGGQGAGVYNYCVTYEWNDNNDRTDISSPSVAKAITLTAGQAVAITVPTLRLTKKGQVKIVIYRTTANGTILFRITSAIAPLYNDPTVDVLTFGDVLADVDITSNGAMYTQPLTAGANPIVPNSAPPACSLIAAYATRIFIAGLDDPYTLWFSQQTLANSPMQFSSLLTLTTDPDGGPITALARMDANLFIFKSNAIFYISGQGPTATGDSNDFGVPIAIPSGEVGCISQNSIVLTPVGLMFQSSNGIYLLDRGLNVSYKGAPVEKFNGLAITSATIVPNQWAVFTTSGGLALVYDYYYDQWSTFTNHGAIDSALDLGAGDLFVYARPDGTVLRQTPSDFSDDGSAIPFSLTSAPLSFAQLQNFLRVYHAFLLGTYKGRHSLSVALAFDYDQSFTEFAAIAVDAIRGTSQFGDTSPFGTDAVFGGMVSGQAVYQFRVDILRKCQAMQFRITDQQDDPGNEGFTLSAMSLVVGLKKGGNKVPANKQIGAT